MLVLMLGPLKEGRTWSAPKSCCHTIPLGESDHVRLGWIRLGSCDGCGFTIGINFVQYQFIVEISRCRYVTL